MSCLSNYAKQLGHHFNQIEASLNLGYILSLKEYLFTEPLWYLQQHFTADISNCVPIPLELYLQSMTCQKQE